jgi:hypothetical protein
MKRLVLHIGAPKTATKLLQKKLFNHLDQIGVINFLGKNSSSPYEKLTKNFIQSIKNRDDIKCHPIIKLFKDDVVNLISDESLSTGHEDLDFVNESSYTPLISLPFALSQLEKIGIKVNVVYVIRSQVTLVPSEFVEGYGLRYKFFPKTNNLKSFMESSMRFSLLYSHTFHFFEVYKKISNTIGRSNVSCILYEDLLGSHNEFCNSLCEILNIPEAVSKEIDLSKREHSTKLKKDRMCASRHIWFGMAVRLEAHPFIRRRVVNIKKNIDAIASVKSHRTRRNILTHLVKITLWLDKIFPCKEIENLSSEEKKVLLKYFSASNAELFEQCGIPRLKAIKYKYII